MAGHRKHENLNDSIPATLALPLREHNLDRTRSPSASPPLQFFHIGKVDCLRHRGSSCGSSQWCRYSDKMFAQKPVQLLEWDSVAHCIKTKRPAHLSIVERLGGFWCCKGTAFIWNSQTYLKKKNKSCLRNPLFASKCYHILSFFLFPTFLN